MVDSRLIGTWKSDTRRTMKGIRNRRDIPEESYPFWRKILGKLEFRYTRQYVYSSYKGEKDRSKYRVIAKDESSVVIQIEKCLFEENKLVQIFFGKDCYWIHFNLEGSDLRECFKRVDKPTR